MTAYLRLHLTYLFNRYFLFVLIIAVILVDFGIIYNSGVFDGYGKLDLYRAELCELNFRDTISLILIFSNLFMIIIGVYLNNKARMNLAKYTIQKRFERLQFIVSGLVVVFALNVFILFEAGSVYILAGYYLTPFTIDVDNFVNVLGKILFENTMYLLFTSLLMLVFRSLFVVILPLAGFWINLANADYTLIKDKSWLRLLNSYVPNLIYQDSNYRFYHDETTYVLPLIITICLYVFLFLTNDIN